jgi:hypothetical protein
MKFITTLILTAFLSFVVCLYLPWWSIAIAAFIVAAVIPQTPRKSFLSGFTALFLLWGTLAFYISNNNDNLLAHKVSLIILKTDSPFALILVTALIGALVAAFAALAGSYLREPKSTA